MEKIDLTFNRLVLTVRFLLLLLTYLFEHNKIKEPDRHKINELLKIQELNQSNS